jgi:predicted Zn-dependent peptidase
VRQGQITEEELKAAKQALISGLRGTHDAPGSIESYYSNAALSGLGLTPAEYIQRITQVDAAQVAAAAGQLRLDTVYFLKGVQ